MIANIILIFLIVIADRLCGCVASVFADTMVRNGATLHGSRAGCAMASCFIRRDGPTTYPHESCAAAGIYFGGCRHATHDDFHVLEWLFSGLRADRDVLGL